MSWRCFHGSSGFSISKFLHVIPDKLDDGEITSLCDYLCKQKSHRIITINGKRNVWKCKPIFPTDTTAKDRNDWLKIIVVGGENNNGLRLLHSSVIHTLHAEYIVYKCIVYSA